MSGVTYLDSAGIRLVIELRQQRDLRRQRMALVVEADAPIHRVLELTDISPVVPVSAGIEEAAARVAAPPDA